MMRIVAENAAADIHVISPLTGGLDKTHASTKRLRGPDGSAHRPGAWICLVCGDALRRQQVLRFTLVCESEQTQASLRPYGTGLARYHFSDRRSWPGDADNVPSVLARHSAHEEREMLRSMSDLENYAIGATDGSIGHVEDFYFDDQGWVIRYLVVKTGAWLAGRKVLISPIAVGEPNWTERVLPVAITKAQVKNSPDIDTDKPVSRQHEQDYTAYYGYPGYWGSTGMWGYGVLPERFTETGSGQGGTDSQNRIAPSGDRSARRRHCQAEGR